jgi:CubicO group peptidase (beta-lactamase class C family)
MANLNHEYASTRRTLLKAGAVSAAAGATTPWIARSAVAVSASTTVSAENRERSMAAMNGGGLSEDRLERMDQIMAGVVERGDLPGLVALVSRGGQTHVTAVGTREFDGNTPMERDTIFRILSVTKPITAAATMMLIEDGVLRLDDPVDPLLPELANRQVLKRIDGPLDETEPANRPITLRDLLTFRLGYGAIFTPSPLQEAMTKAGVAPGPVMPELAEDELMAAYGSLPLAHQPGTQWLYNSGAEILGVLIARATGQSLGEVFQERIFTPLGMKDTAFSVPADKLDRFPAAYWTNFETGKREQIDGIENSRWSRPPVFENGAGGLVSTADDLLSFGEMMLNMGKDGDQRLLSRPSVEVMTTDQLTPEQKAASVFFPGFWDNRGWGFGVSVITRRDALENSPGRYGWDGGWGTSWYVDPTEGLIGILLTQRVWDATGVPKVYADFWNSAYASIDD